MNHTSTAWPLSAPLISKSVKRLLIAGSLAAVGMIGACGSKPENPNPSPKTTESSASTQQGVSQSSPSNSPPASPSTQPSDPQTMNTHPSSPALAGNKPATPASPSTPVTQKTDTAYFALGCFWTPQLKFAKTDGVIDTAVGYMGGATQNPTYKEVCYEDTGHAEVVKVVFDPAKVSYKQLVEMYFAWHDPTQVNRQGPDVGDQYRSAIFAVGDEQAKIAGEVKIAVAASGKFSKPIATKIEPAPTFWKAEEFHQHYLKKRGMDSCSMP
jgi:peptide-methionine (S)-S-oxide reductase